MPFIYRSQRDTINQPDVALHNTHKTAINCIQIAKSAINSVVEIKSTSLFLTNAGYVEGHDQLIYFRDYVDLG